MIVRLLTKSPFLYVSLRLLFLSLVPLVLPPRQVVFFVENATGAAYCDRSLQKYRQTTLAMLAERSQYTTTVMATIGCPASVVATNTLLAQMRAPVVLILTATPGATITTISKVPTSRRATMGGGSNSTSKRVGQLELYHVGGEVRWDEASSLKVLAVSGFDMRGASLEWLPTLVNLRQFMCRGPSNVSRILLGNLSAAPYTGAGLGLAALPDGLGRTLLHLQNVDLNWAQFTEVPRTLMDLVALTGLYLKENKLSRLPPEIGRLSRLQYISASGNQWSSDALPSEIGRLTSLKNLYLDGKKTFDEGAEHDEVTRSGGMRRVPSELGGCINLESLSLERNALTKLPESMVKLTKLEVLYASDNQLVDLPPHMCHERSKMVRLYVGNNRLSNVPAAVNSCRHLKYIDLRNNRIRGTAALTMDDTAVGHRLGLTPRNESIVLLASNPVCHENQSTAPTASTSGTAARWFVSCQTQCHPRCNSISWPFCSKNTVTVGVGGGGHFSRTWGECTDMRGNGICNLACYNAECGYDQGDCANA